MYIVSKDGRTMAVRDSNQLAAFINNGWVETANKEPFKKPKEVEVPKGTSKELVNEANDGKVIYSREDIEKMAFFSLKSLAKENGIDITDKKGNELKAELIEKLGV